MILVFDNLSNMNNESRRKRNTLPLVVIDTSSGGCDDYTVTYFILSVEVVDT